MPVLVEHSILHSTAVAAIDMERYAHVAPDGTRQNFGDRDNAIIASARAAQPSGGTVRVSDVRLSNGTVLTFEVRWGSQATSAKLPHAPPSGMIQVNNLEMRMDLPGSTPPDCTSHPMAAITTRHGFVDCGQSLKKQNTKIQKRRAHG